MGRRVAGLDLRITLNKRADTAAAAIVHRMMIRSRPRVFLLVLPRRNGSRGVEAAIMAGEGMKTRRLGERKLPVVDRCSGRMFLALKFESAYVSNAKPYPCQPCLFPSALCPQKALHKLDKEHLNSIGEDPVSSG